MLTNCQCTQKIRLKRIWFQVSGTPAKHQWLQSNPVGPPNPYTEGCPSLRSNDNIVISSNLTLFLTVLNTLFITPKACGTPPG